MFLLRRLFGFWLILLLLSAGGIAAFFNQEPIVIRLPYFGPYTTPLGLALIISFAIGASVVVFYFSLEVMKKSFEIRRLKKEIRLSRAHPGQEPYPALTNED